MVTRAGLVLHLLLKVLSRHGGRNLQDLAISIGDSMHPTAWDPCPWAMCQLVLWPHARWHSRDQPFWRRWPSSKRMACLVFCRPLWRVPPMSQEESRSEECHRRTSHLPIAQHAQSNHRIWGAYAGSQNTLARRRWDLVQMGANLCAFLRSSGQSGTVPVIYRIWIKSNVFSSNVHSLLISSTSNLQLGGTKLGWIGERSMPTTSADGCKSANSLDSVNNVWLGIYKSSQGLTSPRCPYRSRYLTQSSFP